MNALWKFTLVLSVAVEVPAFAYAQSNCGSAEVFAAGNKVMSKMRCFARPSISSDCLGHAEETFVKSYGKAQAEGDCPTTTDAPTVEQKVDTFIANVRGFVAPQMAGYNKCAAKKVIAIGKKTLAKAKCESKAIATGAMVDAACFSRAESKFAEAFAKAQTISDCDNATTADTVEMAVDDFIDDLKATLAP